jgi:hypothetical protein
MKWAPCSTSKSLANIIPGLSVPLAAHAGDHVVALEGGEVAVARVLTAAIRMVNESGRWSAGSHGRVEGLEDEFVAQVLGDGPANDTARVQVDHDRDGEGLRERR